MVERGVRRLDQKSILQDIKQLVGGEADDPAFDTDIIVCINSAFMSLHQMGIGPTPIFQLVTGEELWDQFISVDQRPGGISQYIYFHVKLAFDPPSNSSLIALYERQLTEVGQRLMLHELDIMDEAIGGEKYDGT